MPRKSNLITVIVASVIAAATVTAQDEGFLRNLATTTTTPTTSTTTAAAAAPKIPKFFDDNITIPFNGTLGCGACIRGGYIYCIPGAEGSDPSTWGTNKAVCCQNASNCSALTNKAFNCSNSYSDKSLAKAMCPFRKGACGNN